MNAEQKEILRQSVLRVMDSNRTTFGLNPGGFAVYLHGYGVAADREQIVEACEYLTQKELAAEVQKTISRENRAWKITDKGRAFLDENGL